MGIDAARVENFLKLESFGLPFSRTPEGKIYPRLDFWSEYYCHFGREPYTKDDIKFFE